MGAFCTFISGGMICNVNLVEKLDLRILNVVLNEGRRGRGRPNRVWMDGVSGKALNNREFTLEQVKMT